MGHCVHHHSSSVNLWPQLLGVQTYYICYYVIWLWLIRRMWWYVLTPWPSKWGQSPRRMIKGAKQTESMRWCKLTNYETCSRKPRDGNVGGREELTGLVVDASFAWCNSTVKDMSIWPCALKYTEAFCLSQRTAVLHIHLAPPTRPLFKVNGSQSHGYKETPNDYREMQKDFKELQNHQETRSNFKEIQN